MKINVDINLQNKRLKNVALPQQDNDAVTRAFVSQNNGDSYSYDTVDARMYFKTPFHVTSDNGVDINYIKLHTTHTTNNRSGEQHTITQSYMPFVLDENGNHITDGDGNKLEYT